MKLPPPRVWLSIDCVIIILLLFVFGAWFMLEHAYGAWGDDSPGYIYTAGQLTKGEALVVQDNLVQQALTWFGNERYARFVAPAHHEIISPDGWIASRYPIGLSLLMALAQAITGRATAMYAVVPVSAVGVVALTYILTVWWLPTQPPLKRLAGIIAACSVGLAEVFAKYAVAQPMREIPSILFWLLALLALTALSRMAAQGKALRWQLLLAAVAGASLGFSINIRETSGVFILPVLIWLWPRGKAWWQQRQTRLAFSKILLAGFLGLMLTSSISVWNSATITAHKEKFREKDISSIAITSNFDHIQSLSFSNLFDNQGKYRPGVGGVIQYWEVMRQFSPFPPFLLLAVVGIVSLWFSHRRLATTLVSWLATVFVLFAMWINPYPRYILPLLPALAIAAAYGLIIVMTYGSRLLRLSRNWSMILSVGLVAAFALTVKPAVIERNNHIRSGETVYKAITAEDLNTVTSASTTLLAQASTDRPALLLMLGSWRAGLPETIMAHTDLRVIRFPGRPNEQPPLDDLAAFIDELQKTHTIYVWYDATLGSGEQRLLSRLNLALEPTSTIQLSFQPNISIYALTSND